MTRFKVQLFIVHPTLDPAEITAALGLEVHFAHPVGKPRRTPTGRPLPGVYSDTRWRHSILHESEDQYFAEQITDFVDRLAEHKDFLRSIRSTGGEATMIIALLGDGHYGDVVTRETLAKLIDLGLDFGIESFHVPQS